MPTYKF